MQKGHFDDHRWSQFHAGAAMFLRSSATCGSQHQRRRFGGRLRSYRCSGGERTPTGYVLHKHVDSARVNQQIDRGRYQATAARRSEAAFDRADPRSSQRRRSRWVRLTTVRACHPGMLP